MAEAPSDSVNNMALTESTEREPSVMSSLVVSAAERLDIRDLLSRSIFVAPSTLAFDRSSTTAYPLIIITIVYFLYSATSK